MYYTLAKEEPGHASLMRIYLRSDLEGADLPSILPQHSISLSPLKHCPGSRVAELQGDTGMGTRMGPASQGHIRLLLCKCGSGQCSQSPAKD